MFHVEHRGPPTLFDAEQPAWSSAGLPLAWWRFHMEHPGVGEQLAALARAVLRQGHDRISIAMLWETLRFRYMQGSRLDETGPRLPNAHRAYYARWLMETHPDLDGVFSTRPTRTEQPEGTDHADHHHRTS